MLSKKQKQLGAITTVLLVVASAISTLVQPPKTINCAGTPDTWQVYDLGGVEYKSLVILGQYCHVTNFTVRGSVSHGVRVGNWSYPPGTAHDVEVSNFKIYDSTTEGLDGVGGWGSCLKAETNSYNIYFHDGLIDKCGGEAVGITGAEHVKVERVNVIDGKMAGFYVDNSLDVTIKDTTVTCGTNPLYYRNGKPSASYLLGDENYAQLSNKSKLGQVNITNAISYGCGALSYWGGQVEPNGIAGFYFRGTFWNSYNKAWINSGERHSNHDIVVEYKTGAVVTPTPTSIVTNTPTRTPSPVTPTRTPTITPTRTVTPTRTPTAVPTCYPVSVGGKFIGNFCP